MNKKTNSEGLHPYLDDFEQAYADQTELDFCND